MCDSLPTNIQALAPTLVNPSAMNKHQQTAKKNYNRTATYFPPTESEPQVLLRTSDEKPWKPATVVSPHSPLDLCCE